MSGRDNSSRTVLHKASKLVKAGKKIQARQILRNLLLDDLDNLEAWQLLAQVSEHSEERAFSKQQISRLTPKQEKISRSESIREQLLQPVMQPVDVQDSKKSPPLWTAEILPEQEFPPDEEKRVRKRSLAPVWIGMFALACLGLWGLALLTSGFLPIGSTGNLTATAMAQNNAYCAALVQNALDASGEFCDQIGPNKVCYGNITLKAELQPGATENFAQRGDVVAVNRLRRLAAAPLDLSTNEWGVAIFKVMANLPSSLPGQTVTMVVFGNTILDNSSENLEAFYFFSQLGRIVCEKAMYDGLLITMPDGAGIKFTVNGTELTLMGDASLTATRNGEMQVSLHSGTGKIVADGKEQTFSAGEKVTVPLGGPSGADAVGPPSSPEPLSDEERDNICQLTGEQCSSEGDPTAQRSPTPAPSATGTATTTRTPTKTATITPTATNTLFYKTLTPSNTPTSLTLVNTATRTNTPRPTWTPGGSRPTRIPTNTPTNTFTNTPTNTFTNTPTNTFTNTPVLGGACAPAVVSAGSLDNPGGLTDLTMDITNDSGALATISEIRVVWDVGTAGQINSLYLGLPIGGTTNIANPNDTVSPVTMPTDYPLTGPIARRQIADGDTQPLTISFMNNLGSGSGYTVRVTLAETSCFVEASR
jgi:hypothetical protein